MVVVFGTRMGTHFSPKDPGLSAGVSRIVFGQSGLDCLGNSKMNFRTIDWPMCTVCVITKVE